MKKILITGSSGFIGSFLVESALTRGYEVYAGVRKSSSKEYLTDHRINFMELDFSDLTALSKSISEAPYFDFIIHSAGLTKAIRKNDFMISNYQYSKNFIDVLINQNRIPEKFIYMSSLAAYGPGEPDSKLPIRSLDTPNPITLYGKSKLEAEKYLTTLINFPYIIIRPTAVYGPREKDLLTVFKLINNHIELLIGSKQHRLTFIYVKDLVNIIFQAMESDIVNKGFFVSDGKVYDALYLGQAIKEYLNKKTVRLHIPLMLVRFIALMAEGTKFVTGKQPILNSEKLKELESVNWVCDIQPLVDQFNFKPDYNLGQGVSETINWYKKRNWLK